MTISLTPTPGDRPKAAELQTPLLSNINLASLDSAGKKLLTSPGVSLKDREERARIAKIALIAGAQPPGAIVDLFNQVLPIWRRFVEIMSTVLPIAIRFFNQAKKFHDTMPVEVVKAVYGLALCFFGGSYIVAISAIEAFRMSGGDTIKMCVTDLWEEYKVLKEKSDLDDKEDLDGDGICDVLQISKQDLAQRKINLILQNMNPDKLTEALGGLYQGFLSVLMTLKFEFAQAVALAVSIAENARKPVAYVAAPALLKVLPEGSEDWVHAIINYFCKAVAMIFAWTVARCVCAVQSAIQGGHICAQNTINFCVHKLGMKEIDLDETMIDEYIGWALAACGVYYQLMSGFGLPFPFSIILFPLTVVEVALEWMVTWIA